MHPFPILFYSLSFLIIIFCYLLCLLCLRSYLFAYLSPYLSIHYSSFAFFFYLTFILASPSFTNFLFFSLRPSLLTYLLTLLLICLLFLFVYLCFPLVSVYLSFISVSASSISLLPFSFLFLPIHLLTRQFAVSSFFLFVCFFPFLLPVFHFCLTTHSPLRHFSLLLYFFIYLSTPSINLLILLFHFHFS